MKKKGFTLIELLIVVAIIGILAAIAIPNFLNAQVRAKVAKVKSEMNTISTALESYYVDHNTYVMPKGWCYLHEWLTTPVAYCNNVSLLVDPFRENAPDLSNPLWWRYRYMACGGPGSAYDDSRAFPWINEGALAEQFGMWDMTSAGPDRHTYGAFNTGDYIQIYDPTNGTISFGDIWRTQKYSDPRDLGSACSN